MNKDKINKKNLKDTLYDMPSIKVVILESKANDYQKSQDSGHSRRANMF